MLKWYLNMKIGTKITIIVTLLMVITLVSVGLISFNNASDALFTSYESSLTIQAKQASQIVADGLKLIRISLEDTAEAISSAPSEESMAALLEQKKQEHGFTYLNYTNVNSTAATSEETIDFSETEGYKQALEGQTSIDRPEVWDSDGQLYFYGFTPIISNDNVSGIVSVMIPYDDVYKYIKDFKIGETGYAVMLDEAGTVSMHPVTDKVINKENTLELAKSNPDLAALKEIVQKCINRDTGFDQYTYIDGTVKYMAYAPIPDSPWALLLSVPKAELFTQINQLLNMIIISSAISLIVIMAALLLFVKAQVSRPLKTTAVFAKELASGNLDMNITIKSKDEVGQLSSTLDNEVRQAFVTIEKNRIVSEKQSLFQGEQVEKLVLNLERLSRGELYCDMVMDDPDDDTKELHLLFSRISDNLYTTINSIKSYIGEISQILGEMQNGNLNVGITEEYRGDFIALKDSINGIAASLNDVLGDIGMASEQVAAGTNQVSDGSQEISQGAAEQASAIEELTASVTEIAEQTRQNAISANKANELTTAATSEATYGNERMKAMQDAMAQINEASRSISKIIKVIDDIAFQTNILALNAAVEAARAGVHGKGFAVVAEEVRNLAARSAGAAKETTELIEGSISKTEAGTKIADETAEALVSIVEGVEKAALLVGEIANASSEQANAITQVNRGIEQMSQVVQSNSATAEQAAAAAEELSSQAELLKTMVGQFNLKNAEKSLTSQLAAPHDKEKAPAISAVKIDLTDSEFGKY